MKSQNRILSVSPSRARAQEGVEGEGMRPRERRGFIASIPFGYFSKHTAMNMTIFKLIGALGLVLITVGILTKNRARQDIFYIAGGIGLEVYSIYIKDVIFIILQIIFTLAAVYDLIKLRFASRPFRGNISQE